jgi:hypothetical protein
MHERSVHNLSLSDGSRPIQIDVKFGRFAAAWQPSILSFRLPHDTMLGCSLWSADQRQRRPERMRLEESLSSVDHRKLG